MRVAILLTVSIGALALALAPAPHAAPPARASAGGQPSIAGHTTAVGEADLGTALAPPSSRSPSSTPTAPDIRSDLGRAASSVRDPAPQVAARRVAGTKVVFLGDSYTTGLNGAGTGRRGWPAIVARTLGWRATNLAVAGTGFMNPGWTNQPVGTRVAAAIRQKPDVVVIAAGHNDSRWSAATTARAADVVLDRLHRALPDALLVVVAPIWSNGSPPTRCLDLRDHLRRTARSIHAIFVDPLADRWFAGTRQRLIGRDGIHPTDSGHRFIADRILEAIAAT